MLLVLALLGMVLVMASLSTLTSHVHHRVRRHNLIRESKIQRNEYLRSLIERLTEEGSVEVIEDGTDEDDETDAAVEAEVDTGPLAMPEPQDIPQKAAA